MKFLCLIPIVSGELNENCESIEVGKICEDDCVAEFAKCAVDCGSNNECVIDLGSLCFPKLTNQKFSSKSICYNKFLT